MGYIFDPIGELERLLAGKDYFKALLMAASYIEHYGKVRIRWFFDEHNEEYSSNWEHHTKVIDRLSLSQVIDFLFVCGVLEKKIYRNLQDFRRKRSKLVHDWSVTGEIDEDEVQILVRRAIDCLRILVPGKQT